MGPPLVWHANGPLAQRFFGLLGPWKFNSSPLKLSVLRVEDGKSGGGVSCPFLGFWLVTVTHQDDITCLGSGIPQKTRLYFPLAYWERGQTQEILLMEEILHQLIGSLSHYLQILQGFIHPRWCRISSINSTALERDIFGGYSEVLAGNVVPAFTWNSFFLRSLGNRYQKGLGGIRGRTSSVVCLS